ncbi:MAG: hypothetical protein M3Y58_14120 [Chloroflexota bacterium]|nr:hypothetical protein [Chloroflexota bacterium]
MVVRDALKDYESVLEAIEIGKRRGTSQAVLDEMQKTAETALLRYTTLVGTINAADAAIEKISKGEDPKSHPVTGLASLKSSVCITMDPVAYDVATKCDRIGETRQMRCAGGVNHGAKTRARGA